MMASMLLKINTILSMVGRVHYAGAVGSSMTAIAIFFPVSRVNFTMLSNNQQFDGVL